MCQEFCSGGEVYTSKQTDTPRQTATPRWGKIMFYMCLRFYSEGGGIPACLAGYQAHSQGELEGLRDLARSTPGGKLRGLAGGGSPGPHPGESWAHTLGGSRSTPGGCIAACTETDPPSSWLLLWAVCILLECILVFFKFEDMEFFL